MGYIICLQKYLYDNLNKNDKTFENKIILLSLYINKDKLAILITSI